MSLSEWKQLETVIFSSKVTFITMRTIFEYMQLCHIHLYQKIACKKVARVNAALVIKSISGRVDRASASEAVDSGSIPGRIKPKTIKIGIHSFPAFRSAIKGTV